MRIPSTRNGPIWTSPSSGTSSRSSVERSRPCSSSLDATSSSVSFVAHTSGTRTSRRKYGKPADVVFVPVREHDGAHPVGAVLEVAEVRQHEVDAEMLVAREGQACVDDDDVLVQLEDGHVLADLAEPAEGNDAKSRHKESLRGFGGMYFAEPSHAGAAARRPARSRHSLTRSRSPGVASTNGRRKPPTS